MFLSDFVFLSYYYVLCQDLFELERSILHGSDNTKSSLELYLEKPRLGLKAFADIEVLNYWKENGHRIAMVI